MPTTVLAVAASIAASSSAAHVVFGRLAAVVVCIPAPREQRPERWRPRPRRRRRRLRLSPPALRTPAGARAAWTRTPRSTTADASAGCRAPALRPSGPTSRASFSRSSRASRYSSSSLRKQQFRIVRPAAIGMATSTILRSGNPPCSRRRSSFSRRTITGVELLRALDRHTATEALRVEDLEQRREAVGVPVVRRRRQEQPVLEPRRQLANGLRELRVDRRSARRWPAPRCAPRPGSAGSGARTVPSQSRSGEA